MKMKIALVAAIAALSLSVAFGAGLASASGDENSSGGGSSSSGGGNSEPGSPGTGGPIIVDPPIDCVAIDPGPNAPPDTPVVGCPDPNVPPVEPIGKQVQPRPGMADVYAQGFDSATLGDDDRTVTIDFVGGVDPCYVLDHIDVKYGTDTITITLFQGHDPSAGDQAVCIDIGVFYTTTVTLDEPAAGRTIVDGAAS